MFNIIKSSNLLPTKGIDCPKEFRSAYQNRYTWSSNFRGYKGKCDYCIGTNIYTGIFSISNDFKPIIIGLQDLDIVKLIQSQLFEFAIHRVRRSFDDIHGNKIFKFGDENEYGKKILLENMNSQDHYRIKDNVITKVERTIHNKIVVVYTNSIVKTNSGYLGHEYTSQYKDPSSRLDLGPLKSYKDNFEKLSNSDDLVLSERIINKNVINKDSGDIETYKFYNLENI